MKYQLSALLDLCLIAIGENERKKNGKTKYSTVTKSAPKLQWNPKIRRWMLVVFLPHKKTDEFSAVSHKKFKYLQFSSEVLQVISVAMVDSHQALT